MAQGLAAQPWTEQRVLELFDRQSPMRRESQAATAAALEAMRARTFWPNPVAGYSRETVGFTEFVTGEQTLPISGAIGFQRRALPAAQQAGEAQGDARLWEARSLVRAAYRRALFAQEQGQAVSNALRDLNSIVELLRIREREGEGSRYDRMRVEREAADLRADVALAGARTRSELAVLLAYLPVDTRIDALEGSLQPRAVTVEREAVLAKAIENRAEVRAELSRIEQMRLEQQAADRQRIPSPSVFAGLKRTNIGNGAFSNSTGSGAVVGISVPLPVFNKGQAEVARLTAEITRSQARIDGLKQQIAAGVLGAYDVLEARRAALAAFEQETGGSGAELTRIARIGYEDGELGILQLLDALRLTRQTALRRLELQAAVQESETELARNAGFEVTQ
jgi:cobalt-zinc-cadmium efflux system outer membrane protein